MEARRTLALMVLVIPLVVAGCATTYDSAVPAGTGIGAAGGALIGYGLTGSGLGAAAGAGAGALAGALTGVAIDESRRTSAPPPPGTGYPPPTPQYQPYQPAPQAYAPDPTRGEFFNATAWRIEVHVDDGYGPVYLKPRDSYPVSLDIGVHHITAKAFVDTQFGERLVGTCKRSVNIDPRGSGWSFRFDPSMF